MSYSWEFANTPAGRVFKAIQLRGKASIKEVASDLGVTTSAVRLHLSQLQSSGAIHADEVREGVGRPHYVYSVTPEAHRLFYRDYGDLTRLLLEEVSASQGPEALQEVLDRVSERLVTLYRDQVRGKELAERVRAWASVLDQRGIAVRIEKAGDGFALEQYGCPYHNVAVENRAVCEMEQQVMGRLLGAEVSLTHCVVDGHYGCEFEIVSREERTKS